MSDLRFFKRLASVATVCAAVLELSSSARAQCPEQVSSHLGAFIANPVTSFVIWQAPDPRPDWQFLWVVYQNILNTPEFYGRVSQYGTPSGHAGQLFLTPTNAAHGALNESWIINQLVSTLDSAHHVPLDSETFVIVLPPGTTSKLDTQGKLGGHHDFFLHTFSDGRQHVVPYSIVEYSSDFTFTTIAISHELYETYTDAIPGWGWWDGTTGSRVELADVCVNATNNTFPPFWQMQAGWAISKIWSQFLFCTCL